MDGALGDETWTPYDFAIEEIGIVSANLSRALLARTLTKGAMPERECAEARRVYDKLNDLHPRLRLATTERATLVGELALLRSQLKECDEERS